MEVTTMQTENRILVRRVVLFGVPFVYIVLGLLHTANPELGDETTLFIALHYAQLFLIGGLAYMFWLLVDGLGGRAARLARALVLPFVIVYTAVDAVLGIAWGTVVEKANELPTGDRAAADRLIDQLLDPEPIGGVFYFGAGLLFLAVVLAVVAALGSSAPSPARILMTVGALVFVLGHARPVGPIGMALFLTGILWLELRTGSEDAERTVPVQAA